MGNTQYISIIERVIFIYLWLSLNIVTLSNNKKGLANKI